MLQLTRLSLAPYNGFTGWAGFTILLGDQRVLRARVTRLEAAATFWPSTRIQQHGSHPEHRPSRHLGSEYLCLGDPTCPEVKGTWKREYVLLVWLALCFEPYEDLPGGQPPFTGRHGGKGKS